VKSRPRFGLGDVDRLAVAGGHQQVGAQHLRLLQGRLRQQLAPAQRVRLDQQVIFQQQHGLR
jgi:hypothetical protein